MAARKKGMRFYVPSLISLCKQLVVENLTADGASLQALPVDLQEKCLHYMARRGLLTDKNLKNALHKNLKKLDLSNSSVTQDGISQLRDCPKVRKLNLNSQNQEERFSSASLSDVFSMCHFIQVLNLSHCCCVDDATITSLSEHCHVISCLNLSNCSRVTDRSMKALGKNCPCLAQVNFSRNSLTDEGIAALLEGQCHRTLEEMLLKNIEEISENSVKLILSVCPKLSIINFSGCPRISDDAVSKCPNKLKQIGWTVYM